MSNLISSYTNGNTDVKIYDDGTRVMESNDDEFNLEYPVSMDVKITNYCDAGCKYCHENSNTNGKHADVKELVNVLSQNPFKGIEYALGGGNPLAYPNLDYLIDTLSEKGYLINLTVNRKHLGSDNIDYLRFLFDKNLIRGLGISVIDCSDISTLLPLKDYHIVYHNIAGIAMPSNLDDLYAQHPKANILILGYKEFGRGVNFAKRKDNIKENIDNLGAWLVANYNSPKIGKIAFDDLAVEQLRPYIDKMVSKEFFDSSYHGSDGTISMYYDAVKKQFARNSRTSFKERVSSDNINIKDFFKKLKGDKNE